LGGVGECRPCGEHAEQHHADLHHDLATESVAQPTACEQEPGEDQRIRVDDPLQTARRCLEFSGESGDRHIDDEVVDDDEEDREAENGENPPTSLLHSGVGVGESRGVVHVDNV